MSKSIIYFAIFSFLTIRIFAQEKILINEGKGNGIIKTQASFIGKITDAKTGEPLSDASIIFPDLKLGTHADNSGRFQFANVPAGHHLIEISHVGYSSVIEHIDIDKKTEKDFALQPSILENQGVIVTGVSNATNIRKTPVPVAALR